MKEEKSKTYQVFVYGTLMQGGRNSYLLSQENATLIAEKITTTSNIFFMFQFNSASSPGKFSPAVLPHGDGFIQGEIYEVNEAGLAALDKLEGNSDHYQREEVELQNGSTAWMYILKRHDLPAEEQGRINIGGAEKIYSWNRDEPKFN